MLPGKPVPGSSGAPGSTPVPSPPQPIPLSPVTDPANRDILLFIFISSNSGVIYIFFIIVSLNYSLICLFLWYLFYDNLLSILDVYALLGRVLNLHTIEVIVTTIIKDNIQTLNLCGFAINIYINFWSR